MSSFFFEQFSHIQKFLVILVCLTVFWRLEHDIPLFRFKYRKWSHAWTNFVFLGCAMGVNVLFAFATVGIFSWIAAHRFGLLYLIELPRWIDLIVAVMLFDFISQYVAHFLLHKVELLWRLHVVHHGDTYVDVTTGTRHHPADYIVRELFALAAMLFIGAQPSHYLAYRVASIIFTYFTHANILIPEQIDRAFHYIFVTPKMHKFHHHFERPWTDRNYGNIFSFWDRFFGTLVYGNVEQVQYGLDILDDANSNDLMYQLKLPLILKNDG